jgi:uncharacterized protein YbjT (DUF2867 family)
MAKIFITRATSQIGSHLAEYLVNRKELGVSEHSDLICLARSLDTAKHLQQFGVQKVLGDILNLN